MPKIMMIAAEELHAQPDAQRVVDFVASIASADDLTKEGIMHVLGVTMHGTKIQQAEFMFSAIDKDGNGNLDRAELGEVIRLQSMKNSSSVQGTINVLQMADELLRLVDTDRNGSVSMQEFVDAQDIIMRKLLYIELAVM
eukprot:TRINITY_DN31288_c0_g1_i1.p2 TRINITY_DN31288_c0_g1~~TRINITY_DN31288_c0_g1_i1.p2  ORF type:complete len:140 (+),score=32.55 TRINITY_DN31288_c0_g1_i1:68-487(+)